MDSLLRWGIANSTGNENNTPPPRPRQDLDPGIIDAILGKPDSELMKEALAVAVDEKQSEDDRVQALDNFEMLIEHIDNANNIEKLKMWDPLQELLTSPSSSDAIKTQTLWVIGTAVQNNPSAQKSYLSKSPMAALLDLLSPSVKSKQLRSKAVYALSSLLKHSAAAVKEFDAAGGWDTLKAALEDSDISVRRKTAFLLSTLIIPSAPNDTSSSHVRNPPPTSAPSESTAVISHPTASTDTQPPGAPIHPNSHADMLADPSSFSTSPITLEALQKHGLLDKLVLSLTSPTPFGPDGESERDSDYEEKVVYLLRTYVIKCKGQLSPEQKKQLREFLQEITAKAGSEEKLVESWPLTVQELRELKQALE